MTDQWFVQRDGKRIGPIPTATLKRLAATGKLKSSDQVQKQGMNRFVRAGAIKGLFAGATRRLAVSRASVPTIPVDDTANASSDPEAEAGTDARKSGWASGARLAVVAATAAVLLGTLIAAGIGLSMRASGGKNSSNKENQSASRSAESISPETPLPVAHNKAGESEPRPSPESVAVFRSLARRLSFSYFRNEGTRLRFDEPPEPDSQLLFIPYCDAYLHNARSYSGLWDTELSAYDTLLNAGDQELHNLVNEVRRIFSLRVKLNLFNEMYGLTASSSIERTRAAIWDNALRDVAHRDQDFEDAQRSAKDILGRLRSTDEVSAVAKYADMNAVDKATELWQQGLLPWTKKTSSAVVDAKMVILEPRWAERAVGGDVIGAIRFQALHHLSITNVCGDRLTNVVVEAQVTNEWKDDATNYYFIPVLEAGSTYYLLLHPRWVGRRMYSRDVMLTYSVWAEQRSNAPCTVRCGNPQPVPEAETYRKNVLRWDNGDYGEAGASLANKLYGR